VINDYHGRRPAQRVRNRRLSKPTLLSSGEQVTEL